jgi:hypothetical protein
MKRRKRLEKLLFTALFTFIISLSFAGQAVCQTCVEVPEGIISWWPGDNSPDDIVGENDGTLQGDFASYAEGYVGSAFSVRDGSYVAVPDHPSLNPTSQITVATWIRRSTPYGYADPVVKKSDGNQTRGYALEFTGNSPYKAICFWVYLNGPGWKSSGCYTIDGDEWTHIAGVYDGTKVCVYVNGALGSYSPASGEILPSSSELNIGLDPSNTWRYYNGLIDEVTIFDRALSAAEIQDLVSAGQAGMCKVPENQPPIANAGPDQTVDEFTSVTLDGSASYDPEEEILSFSWNQTLGTLVVLDDSTSATPSFAAPEVTSGGETLTFELIVYDGELFSEPAVVNIFVMNVNHPPVADAGVDQTVKEGSTVMLDGEGSYDPDGEDLSYEWEQEEGPAVTLSDASAINPTFTAPPVGSSSATLTFVLCVSDGSLETCDTVSVFVEPVNHDPVADAGPDQTVDECSPVTLDGTASQDPDNDTLIFEWAQLTGPTVTLSDPSSPTPNFTAPLVSPGGETLGFELTVNDGHGGVGTDEVFVHVQNTNDPPNCTLAAASPATVWPPNHRMVPISIVNVADPDNDQVTITIIGVTQDEPVNGLGDGDTSPDAAISDGNVMIRAERAGGSNGRIYEITFMAEDGSGEACMGSVTVCVPHNKKSNCVDDGATYDSTQP